MIKVLHSPPKNATEANLYEQRWNELRAISSKLRLTSVRLALARLEPDVRKKWDPERYAKLQRCESTYSIAAKEGTKSLILFILRSAIRCDRPYCDPCLHLRRPQSCNQDKCYRFWSLLFTQGMFPPSLSFPRYLTSLPFDRSLPLSTYSRSCPRALRPSGRSLLYFHQLATTPATILI